MIRIKIKKSVFGKYLLLVTLSSTLLATATVLSGCADDQARAQLADINSRLSKLEAENTNKGTQSSKRSIDTLNKLDNLQSQIDQLNGNVSTISNNQKTYQATQEQLNQSIQQQIQGLETNKTSSATNTTIDNGDVSPQSTKSDTASGKGDAASLKIALKKMKQKQFSSAINTLKKIISNSDSSQDVIADAQYYLAIAYAADGKYKSAVGTARDYVKKYPDSKNAPDALRIMYISQKELNWDKSAEKTKKALLEKYPHSQAAKKISQ